MRFKIGDFVTFIPDGRVGWVVRKPRAEVPARLRPKWERKTVRVEFLTRESSMPYHATISPVNLRKATQKDIWEFRSKQYNIVPTSLWTALHRKSRGLTADKFQYTVEVFYEDLSHSTFQYAFVKDYPYDFAIFTEHCGVHLLSKLGIMRVLETTPKGYRRKGVEAHRKEYKGDIGA